MIKASNREKVTKHYMNHSDFELDHHKDVRYPAVEPHYHEFFEILYFISGHVDYIVGDKLFHLQNDDLLLIPPNILHNPVFHDFHVPYERYVLWISVPALKQLLSIDPELEQFFNQPHPPMYLLRHQAAQGSFRPIFASLEQTLEQKRPLSMAQLKLLVLQLILEYNQALLNGSSATHTGVRDSLITNVLHYIQNNLTEDLSLDAISRDFLIDKFNLSHMFKENMGISYHRYVLQQRLLLGKTLLMEGIPASQVCFSCGFQDYSSFFRAFKREYDVSPAQFKKLHSGSASPLSQP